MIGIRRLHLVLFLVCIAGGCAAPPRAVPPPQWPATFSGRTLFYPRNTLIYARDDSTADTLAEHLGNVCQDFTQTTGQPPTSGLVIVNDVDDSQIGNLNLDKLLPQDKREPDLAAMGLTTGDFVLAVGLPINKEQIADQPGFTEPALRTIQWVVSIPSDRRMAQFDHRLIDAALKKQNLNLVQRLLIMPFLPLVRSLLDDAMNAERDTAIYQCFCNAQPGWSDDRRKKELADYQKKRMGEVVKTLKATTQQASHAKEP